MKKAFLMALACLLLAGCGAPSETVTPTDSWPDSALAETNEAAAESPPEPISTAPAESPPATAPAEPLSAPAVVTAGQAPEEPYDLPTEVIGLKDWIGESRWNHDPVGLLAELPERELSLYGVTKWLDSSALLRWGDSLAEFSWSPAAAIAAPAEHTKDQKQDNPGGPIAAPAAETAVSALVGRSHGHGHHSAVRRKTHCVISFVDLFSKPGRDFD